MNALRDWGHAKDYIRMQWMMLQQEKPKDYVIATGVQYSVRQPVSKCPVKKYYIPLCSKKSVERCWCVTVPMPLMG